MGFRSPYVKTEYFSSLKYNRFKFGKQEVSQFVIFEFKWLFSIIIFYFHKCDDSQDRFHTHAFNALSFKLFGEYDEHILDDESNGSYHTERRTQVIKYFPRDSYHRRSISNLSNPAGGEDSKLLVGDMAEDHMNKVSKERKGQIGNGNRGSEKKRTYNQKMDLVIDHESDKSTSLKQFMKGKLELLMC